MKIFERYFERNRVEWLLDFPNRPEVIVIVPVLNDRDIFATADALKKCVCRCGNAGVLIIVNHGEDADEAVKRANRQLAAELRETVCCGQKASSAVYFEVAEAFDLPAKWAGVGLARKIAMDAAACFFYRQGRPECPILSLDADTWMEVNYLDETIRYFREHPVAGVSIAYAHRLDECGEEVADAMVKYELYLRYYRLALAYTGHPYAFHCIGSAFAVRASDYVAQGGMNKRQAGEDFYFLQKLISTGRFATLQGTRVYPSARFSTRTPFGTGQAVRQIVENGGAFPVYDFAAFRALRHFFSGLPVLYKADRAKCEAYFLKLPSGIRSFLAETDGLGLLEEVNANCASLAQFRKRFFDRFNAFRVLKYLNFVHEGEYRKVDVRLAAEALFRELAYPWVDDCRENLEFLRKAERIEKGDSDICRI